MCIACIFCVIQSGAILGMIALFCTYFPEKQLSIALVDQIIPHSFSAGNVSMRYECASLKYQASIWNKKYNCEGYTEHAVKMYLLKPGVNLSPGHICEVIGVCLIAV